MNQIGKLAVKVVVAMTMLCIVGCGGSGPNETANACVACLKKGDFKGMRKFATGDFVKRIDEQEAQFAEYITVCGKEKGEEMIAGAKATFGKLKYEFGDVHVDGEKATVEFKINGESTPIKLRIVDGEWRIEKFDFWIM